MPWEQNLLDHLDRLGLRACLNRSKLDGLWVQSDASRTAIDVKGGDFSIARRADSRLGS